MNLWIFSKFFSFIFVCFFLLNQFSIFIYILLKNIYIYSCSFKFLNLDGANLIDGFVKFDWT